MIGIPPRSIPPLEGWSWGTDTKGLHDKARIRIRAVGKIRLETLDPVAVDHVPAGLLLLVLENALTAGRDELILADQPIFIGIDDCQYGF